LTLPPRTYFLGLILDPDHRVTQGAAARATIRMQSAVTVAPAGGGQPDLTPSSIATPNQVKIGSAANVTATVFNQGSLDVTTTFDVKFFLSLDQVVDAADVPLATLSSAPPGA